MPNTLHSLSRLIRVVAVGVPLNHRVEHGFIPWLRGKRNYGRWADAKDDRPFLQEWQVEPGDVVADEHGLFRAPAVIVEGGGLLDRVEQPGNQGVFRVRNEGLWGPSLMAIPAQMMRP